MSRRLVSLGIAVAWSASVLLIACGGDNPVEPEPEPPEIASIEVTSAVDTLLDLGSGATLTATPRDAGGQVVTGGPQIMWSSSNRDVASVGASSGQVTTFTTGAVTITAAAGDASGTIRMVIIDADVAGLTATAADPYAGSLVAGLAGSGAATTAWAGIGTGLGTGNLASVVSGLATLEDAAAAATGHDRALLAVLMLYADHMHELLNL